MATPTGTTSDGVPEEYRTATGLDGGERDPSALSTQSAVKLEYLTEDDITELSAFDSALAEKYRGQLLE